MRPAAPPSWAVLQPKITPYQFELGDVSGIMATTYAKSAEYFWHCDELPMGCDRGFA
jgi:hypothetical protein